MTMQTWNDVRSQSLAMATSATVFTPENMGSTPTRKPGLLILLHGLTGNHAVWAVRTDLQALADKHNLVIALPDGARSFWIDQSYGLPWGTWVGKEFPQMLRSTLRISRARKDSFIGGLSMGGYGAIHTAFDYPRTFGGALSLSGTLDVAEDAFRGRHPDLYQIGFGDEKRPRPQDDLIGRLSAGEGLDDLRDVKIFATCGDGDRLLEQNRRFQTAAESAGLDLTYREGKGVHNYRFWNEWLPIALEQIVGLPT